MRKVRELLIARRLEAELSKTRILELYLNVIEWGDGIYGAEAAARTYFGKSSAALGPQEAALLAAAIISPREMDPGRPTARLQGRQQMILRRMGARTRPPPPTGLPAAERALETAEAPPVPEAALGLPEGPSAGPCEEPPC